MTVKATHQETGAPPAPGNGAEPAAVLMYPRRETLCMKDSKSLLPNRDGAPFDTLRALNAIEHENGGAGTTPGYTVSLLPCASLLLCGFAARTYFTPNLSFSDILNNPGLILQYKCKILRQCYGVIVTWRLAVTILDGK